MREGPLIHPLNHNAIHRRSRSAADSGRAEEYNRRLVFEIGNSLREARLRQGVDLARAEDETKIRAKYLQALEDERFDILPAETYVKGFLRTYAEYLGLDGQLYVDEFNSRFAASEEVFAPTPAPRRKTRQRASESNLVVVALAGIVAIAILVVVAATLSSGETPADPATGLGQDAGNENASPPAGSAPTGRTAKLALTAAGGPCWVSVRSGSPDGELLFAGTIERGKTLRFVGPRMWLEFETVPCENFQVRLNGRRVRDFPSGEPVVIVTPQGVRAQA